MEPDSTRERLAAWLEELGLVDHLADAGLPTMVRDGEGRAVWSDPGTGAELSDDQVVELDMVLHQEGSEPAHAVPVPLLQIARQARVHDELLTSPWHTYDSLARLRGATPERTRFAVHKAAGQHRLLVVTGPTGVMVPAFQLDADGEVRPELAPLLEPLLAAGLDGWKAWAWLTRPAALAAGLVPEQGAGSDDPADVDVVRRAAQRLARTVSEPPVPPR